MKNLPATDNPYKLIEFKLPTPLRRKLDAKAQKRVEHRLRTIISEQILYASIKLKVPTHKATQIIKENRQSIIKHLKKVKKIMENESIFETFSMTGYAKTTEDRTAWMQFPDILMRVIRIYEKSLTHKIFPSKGVPLAAVAANVLEVLKEEGISPKVSRTGIWAVVTKYVIECARRELVSDDRILNALRLSLSLSANCKKCKTHKK